MLRTIALTALVLFPTAASAATVTPTSYTYIIGPNADRQYSYPDQGGTQLTDGIAPTLHWSLTENGTYGYPNVGFFSSDKSRFPTIEFFFDQTYRFTEMVMNIQDTGGGAGVGIADAVNVNGLTTLIASTGANGPVNVVVDLAALLPDDSLIVTIDPRYVWTFVQEFTFSGEAFVETGGASVPLPAGLPMMLLGLGSLAALRRRKS